MESREKGASFDGLVTSIGPIDQIILKHDGSKPWFGIYISFSIPDKLSDNCRLFTGKFVTFAAIILFVLVTLPNPRRSKWENMSSNKICENYYSGDRWSPRLYKSGNFQVVTLFLAPPVAKNVILCEIDQILYFTSATTRVCEKNAWK